jgi:putative membrane-bound dehydrogenase-like protein
MPRRIVIAFVVVAAGAAVAAGCAVQRAADPIVRQPAAGARLVATHDEKAQAIVISRTGEREPLFVHHVEAHARPRLSAGAAAAGVSGDVYWGFTQLNGRDYLRNLGGEYWRRVSAGVLPASGADGNGVSWQVVYDLLDSVGTAVLTATERWTMRERDRRLLLDVEWRGEAKTSVTIGNAASGGAPSAGDAAGLLLRIPARADTRLEVTNAARQSNARADGQRAMWIDVALRRDAGQPEPLHVALFDHPDNIAYPQRWRIEPEGGIASARSPATPWTIATGQTEVLRHQLVIYTGTLSDVELTAAWTEYSGHRSTYSTSALWGIAQQEGRQATFLTGDQAAAQMTLLDGYVVKAWAAEPAIVQPMAFCWDDRGRLWVAENRDYESRVEGFSNAGTSRIVILEDTDRDGVADSRKVFLDGIVFPAAIAVGFDGVFVGAPPNLLFVPDRDGDDKADVADIEVRLTGWGIRDRHETINSLHWGPDGWLYGLQGYATPSKVRKPKGDARLYKRGEPFPEALVEGEGAEGVAINGGVWRYHPTKDRFEVVAHGFSNPWGIDYDAKGQLFISACVIPHLWHVVPGGIYHRQGGQHFNPYVYDDIKTIADHRHRSAHGGARIYQSDAFPTSQHGRIFMANIHEHAVLSDVLTRKGSGFSAKHGDDFLLANNAQWIGFSLEIGPDGALYVLDWHDADICGIEVLHQETGRIFRVAPARSLAQAWEGRYADLRRLSDAQLVDLQTSTSDWHARRARVILQARAAKGALQPDTHARLRRMFEAQASGDTRLRAMWSLHVTGGWTPEALAALLGDADEHVRGWAIQLLCEDGPPPSAVLDTFARMAREDRSAVVRLYLASALQRLEPAGAAGRWNIAAALMAHAEDAADHNLPKMIWLGVEPLVAQDPAFALSRAADGEMPLVTRFIARRTVDADALEPLVAAISRESKAQRSLLEGMRDGLEGRFDVEAPPNWAAVRDKLQRSAAPLAQLASEVTQQFGDSEAARQNLATATSATAPLAQRRRALQILSAQRRPQLAAALPAMLDDREVRVDAIRAAAAFDDPSLGRLLIDRYPTLSAAEKTEAILTLSSRPRYGRALTEALAKNAIPKTDIPAHSSRQLLRVAGTRFLEVWGPIERNIKEDRAYARYRGLLNDTAMAKADRVNGRALYQRTCGACHTMFGEGGTIGPDLTGSNRTNLDYLLFNVLDPNADVAEAYRMVVVTTRDGRTYSGNVVAETDRQLTLRVVGQDAVVVSKSDIQSRESTAVSMMPPGLFDALTDREVIDLVGYLRSLEQVK